MIKDNIEDYLANTHGGKELVKKYGKDLKEHGVWAIRGEDPNCDFGGSHHQPLLSYVEGNLYDVVKIGITLPSFWQWGSGAHSRKSLLRLWMT